MEKSFIFNSVNGDRKYKADDFREYFSSFIGNGVFPNPSNQLQILSNNNMTITVLEGKGWINGAIYVNTDNLILTIDPADGVLNRIDRIVLRFDTLARNITCKVKKGTFSSNPVPSELQRDADAYELCIAEIRVDKGATSIVQSKITDTRLDSARCGIVTQTINEIDTTTLYNQLQAHIEEKGVDMSTWIQKAKEYFSNWLGDTKTEYTNEFNTWFESIKGVLDDDIAGNLLNKINALEDIVNNMKLESGSVMRPDGSTVEASLLEHKTSILELQTELNGQRSKAISMHNRLDKVF